VLFELVQNKHEFFHFFLAKAVAFAWRLRSQSGTHNWQSPPIVFCEVREFTRKPRLQGPGVAVF
jgi:hypothetical protein